MKSRLHLKGKYLWKLCALGVLGIVIGACVVKVLTIDQPPTATVGDVITIKLHDTVSTQQDAGRNPEVTQYVLCMLMPKGWNVGGKTKDGHPITTIAYTSQFGNGTMTPIPTNAIEPSNGNNLTWSKACLAKFGIQNNLVNDMEWVAFESVETIKFPNGSNFNPDPVITIKVGADGNNTNFFPSYVICEAHDGLNDDHTWDPDGPDWGLKNGNCMIVTGGTTGILNDYCNPQLASVDPPKSLENEFITVTYNSAIDVNKVLKGNNFYLCVDAAYITEGSSTVPVAKRFCSQTIKSQLQPVGGGIYKLTLWPQVYFGLTSTETLVKMSYRITDSQGNEVGYQGNPDLPFTYLYQCESTPVF